ncbi:TPA: hypothetical protein ACH3X3_007593 [Trebouxia sp. C0006]
MGGHGGLNILPQKSWNVYGRENRLKVARDEAKFEEENKIKRERHIQAEREARRAALLQKARQRQAEHQVIDVVPAVSAHVHQEAAQQLPEEKQECAGTQAVQPVLPEAQLRTQNNKGQMLKHINFWHEDELKMAHPEVQAEKKMEQKRRGNKDTQTSDAKFDEQFKLGHQMASQPWYSRKASSPPPPEARLPDVGQGIALTAGTDLLLTDAAVKQHSHHKHKKSRKKSRHEKESKVKSVSELRAERQAREQAERSRQDRLLQAHKGFARPR